MLAALDAAEYLEPTPIQAGLIPRALEGADLMGQARTGTGKTAIAFQIAWKLYQTRWNLKRDGSRRPRKEISRLSGSRKWMGSRRRRLVERQHHRNCQDPRTRNQGR